LKVQYAVPGGQAAVAGVPLSGGWQLLAVRPGGSDEGAHDATANGGDDAAASYPAGDDEVPVRVSEDLRVALGRFKGAGHNHAVLVFSELATARAAVVFDLARPTAMTLHPTSLHVASVAAGGQASAGGVEPGWRVESVGPCNHPSAASAARPVSPASPVSRIAAAALGGPGGESAVPGAAVVSLADAHVEPMAQVTNGLSRSTLAAVAAAAAVVASMGTVATLAMLVILAAAALALTRFRSRPEESSSLVDDSAYRREVELVATEPAILASVAAPSAARSVAPESTLWIRDRIHETTSRSDVLSPNGAAAGATLAETTDAALKTSAETVLKATDDNSSVAENDSEFDGWRPEWDGAFKEEAEESVEVPGVVRAERTETEKARSESEQDLLLALWANFEKVRSEVVFPLVYDGGALSCLLLYN
jgi:hypothetical protein